MTKQIDVNNQPITTPKLYTTFELPANYYNRAITLAESDFYNWERKSGGAKQCFNTISSCQVGALAEAAVIYWLRESWMPHMVKTKGVKFNKVKAYGMSEREDGKMRYSKADIEVKVRGKDTPNYRMEVKGVRPHQNHGQITPYHAKKYYEAGIGNIIFVEVDHSEYDGKCYCKIYKLSTPKECLEAPLKLNHYGKLCHTLNLD